MSIAASIEALNHDSYQNHYAVDDSAYKAQQRFLLKLSLLVCKGIFIVFVLGFVIANPVLIPLALIVGVGCNEYYKMQRKDDGTRI